MIPFSLRLRHEVAKAINHHRGLSDDAYDDAHDVTASRNKVVGKEIPDGENTKWNVKQDAANQAWIILATKDEEHYHMS